MMNEEISMRPENPVLDPEKAEKIKYQLLEKYRRYKATLEDALQPKKQEKTENNRRMITVVVSLFDEDDSLLSAKMFEHSFRSIVEQANKDNLTLDFLVVANNSGGKTPEIAEQVHEKLSQLFQSLPDITYSEYRTEPPEQISPSTQWQIPSLSLGTSFEGHHRVSLITQPNNKENRGKPRAIRDVAHHVYKEILEDGYAPDAIFQMDAETVLEFTKQEFSTFDTTPLGLLLRHLERRPETVAVGTKDKFAIMDEQTGLPTDAPLPAPQEGYMYLNRGQVTVPGGAAMVLPADYVAGMMAITEVTTGSITEDYMFTRLIQEANGAITPKAKEAINRSLGVTTHLNRSSEGINAEKQMRRWREHALATDLIFPTSHFDKTPYIQYFVHVATKRVRDIFKTGSIDHVKQAVQDIHRQSQLRDLVTNLIPSDPINGDPDWYRKSNT